MTDMMWLPIQAGRDHLMQFARRDSVAALAELIWNGLDAEADRVDVDIEAASLGGDFSEHSYVTRITVEDNGHGISPEIAKEAFSKLGDSWKRSLNGRTLNGARPLHGSLGRGRLYVYSLGYRARWSSISVSKDQIYRVEISGNTGQLDGFTVEEFPEGSGKPGTRVVIDVEQGRPHAALLKDDLHLRLTAKFAPHLLGNPDIAVRVNGKRLSPQALMAGDPAELPLEIDEASLKGHERPVMTIVDWTEEMKVSTGIVLCSPDGASLVEIEKSAPPGNVRSTGYLRWSGWASSGSELQLAQLEHGNIIDIAKATLAKHVEARTGTIRATIVATLKEEDAYPYPEEISDLVMDAERQMFDLIAVTARTPLRNSSRSGRRMTAALLRLALQERPESLDLILSEALALSDSERVELSELLKQSSLGSIVGAAAEVGRRLDLLAALRHVIYTPGVSSQMREVDQLHPLVRDNVWLFGESWRLSASEAGLTNVLRATIGNDVALEADLVKDGIHVVLPDGKRGRVDLLLQRTVIGPGDRQDRLVVELKRPSVRLGDAQLTQVKRYARALSGHPGVGPSRWTFWLIGADIKDDEIGGELEQTDREWGHVIATEKYDIHVATWGALIDKGERGLKFFREQLNYNVSQDEALRRVRARHEELLPQE
jgi:hypothetical protein